MSALSVPEALILSKVKLVATTTLVFVFAVSAPSTLFITTDVTPFFNIVRFLSASPLTNLTVMGSEVSCPFAMVTDVLLRRIASVLITSSLLLASTPSDVAANVTVTSFSDGEDSLT